MWRKKLYLAVILIILHLTMVFSEELPHEISIYSPAGDKCVILDSICKVLFVLDNASGEAKEISKNVNDFEMSPDKSKFAYSVFLGTSVPGQIQILDLPTMTTQKISDESGQIIRWSSDSKYLFYQPIDTLRKLVVIDLTSNKRKVITLK